MNKRSRDGLDAYYRDAESWASDRELELRKSRSIAWKVAAAAAAIAVMEAAALMLLTPLKKDVPYMMLVDRHTGYVQAIDPLDKKPLTADAALTQAFLAQYVVARESFDLASLQSDYRKVATWSVDRARSDYVTAMQAASPQSPLSRYPRDAIVETRVKSVSHLASNTALVRFDKHLRSGGAAVSATPLGSWVAVVRYRYSGQPMALEDRLVNPLGFNVVSYRTDPETVVPQPAEQTPAPATGASRLIVPSNAAPSGASRSRQGGAAPASAHAPAASSPQNPQEEIVL